MKFVLLLFLATIVGTEGGGNVSTSCGGTLMDFQGEIIYPQYGWYGRYEDCTWIINSSVPIDIHFKRFDVEDHPNCGFDYLQIAEDEIPRGKYCGSMLPPNLTSHGITNISFHSDGGSNGRGFIISIGVSVCYTDNFICDANYTCTNKDGFPACVCNTGFDGNGTNCIDINECIDSTHNCHPNATCTKSIGSYSCKCNEGFYGNGDSCIDINECTYSRHNCHPNATCTNSIGSYSCECNEGFNGNGRRCIEHCPSAINETCDSSNGRCMNVNSIWKCHCFPNFTGEECKRNVYTSCGGVITNLHTQISYYPSFGHYDYHHCNWFINSSVPIDITFGMLYIPYSDCIYQYLQIEENGIIQGRYCGSSLPSNITLNGNISITFYSERHVYGVPFIFDIDEAVCHTSGMKCDMNSTCVNIGGLPVCKCKPGFEENGTKCIASRCQSLALDIVFILDSSGSVSYQYGQELNFVKIIAKEMLFNERRVHVAVVTFSSHAVININLNQYTDISSFNKAVDNIPFLNGGTRIDLGLLLARDMLIFANKGSRSNAQKMLVLLTDGQQGMANTLKDIGKSIRQQGIGIVAIGVGNQIRTSQLISIAGVNNVYNASSFNVISTRKFVEDVINASCSLMYEPGKDGKFYKLHNTHVSWQDSVTQCEDEAGHLAIDDNKETHDYMAEHYGLVPVWIGGRYNSSIGQWIWYNGQPIKNTHWDGVAPKGGLCLQTNYRGAGIWNNSFCGNQLPFLCQKRTDVCSQKDCDGHATCVITSQGAKCICNNGYRGNGTHCEDGTFVIVCHELFVTGIWKRNKIRSGQVEISLNDPSCNNYDGNNTHVWITAKFNGCGSITHEDVDLIIQENTALITSTFTRNNSISRQVRYYYNMKCTFEREKTSSTDNSFNATDQIDRVYRLSTTTFNVSMAIYTSSSFLKIAGNPFSVTSYEPIHIGIKEVNTNENVKFIVHQCYATPATETESARYTFFDMQCGIDPTFKILGYSSNHFNFVIGAFKFIEIRKSVRIHCILYVCKVNSNSPFCTQTCRVRKRRALSEVPSNEDLPVKELSAQTNEISFKKKLSCDDLLCPPYSDCIEMYPAICRCKEGYVFDHKDNTCNNDRVFLISGLHLEMEFLETYVDPSSTDFLGISTEIEEQLHMRLPTENEKIDGLKVVSARHGSVVLDISVIYATSSNRYDAFDWFIKHVMVNQSDTTDSLNITLNIMPTMEIQKIQLIQEENIVLLLVATILPSLLLIIASGYLIYKMKSKRRSPLAVIKIDEVKKKDQIIMNIVS